MAKPVSYPHPVAGRGDEVTGELAPFELDVSKYGGDFILKISAVGISNITLDGFIRDGRASFAARVACAQTYFRESFVFAGNEHTIRIKASRLSERVEVSLRVCARKKIETYRPDGLHPDYGEASFLIDQGDVLAEGITKTFWATSDFDPLAGPVSSIMRIRQGDFDDGPFRVILESDRITIEMSKSDWKGYLFMRSQLPGVLHGAVVLPALTEAISGLRYRQDELQNFLWVERLKDILNAKKCSENDPAVVVAQRLLDGPFSRASSGLMTFSNVEGG
ncbi:hypothetical protein D7Y23_33270 [Corallococcus sp. AB050B]|nr:hypothetical protein D7Y23_33270 [Corallococcus sp. AB050B]